MQTHNIPRERASLDSWMWQRRFINAALARELGVTGEAVRQWRAGIARPIPEHLARLCAVLGVEEEQIVW